MYTESLHFLDRVRGSSDGYRFAKVEFLIHFYFVPFWSLSYLNWHSWWFVFVSTDNDWENSFGFLQLLRLSTHFPLWDRPLIRNF